MPVLFVLVREALLLFSLRGSAPNVRGREDAISRAHVQVAVVAAGRILGRIISHLRCRVSFDHVLPSLSSIRVLILIAILVLTPNLGLSSFRDSILDRGDRLRRVTVEF